MAIGRKKRELRNNLFHKQMGICHYCRCQMTVGQNNNRSVTIDHVLPQVHGGDNSSWNLVGACWQCNALKGNLPYQYFVDNRERLIKERGLPNRARKSREKRLYEFGSYQRIKQNGLVLTFHRSERLPNVPASVDPMEGASLGELWPKV